MSSSSGRVDPRRAVEHAAPLPQRAGNGGARDGLHVQSVKHSTGAGVYSTGDSEQPDANNLVPESEEIESESDTEADLVANSWEGTSSSL